MRALVHRLGLLCGCLVVICWLLVTGQSALAQGAAVCQVDLLFVVDTSPSMVDNLAQACIDADRISSGLQTIGYDVARHVIAVGSGTVACADAVCSYPCGPLQPEMQSWGEAALYWAQQYSAWRPCAKRILIPISDAPMACGRPLDAADDLLLAQLVVACTTREIAAFPMLAPSGFEPDLVQSFEDLAHDTGGRRGELSKPSTAILAIVEYVGYSCGASIQTMSLDECSGQISLVGSAPERGGDQICSWSVEGATRIAPDGCALSCTLVPGSHEIALTVVDLGTGCTRVTTETFDIVGEPACEISVPDAPVCVGETRVSISALEGFDSYAWAFSQGELIEGQGSSGVYWRAPDVSGSTMVTLTVGMQTSAGQTCYSTCSAAIPVEDCCEPPVVVLPAGPYVACDGLDLELMPGYSGSGPMAWSWDFGDGTVSTLPTVSHHYAPGVYDLTLQVTNACGTWRDTRIGYVQVEQSPVAIAPDLVLYEGWSDAVLQVAAIGAGALCSSGLMTIGQTGAQTYTVQCQDTQCSRAVTGTIAITERIPLVSLYEDSDESGSRDAGEGGLDGWTIELESAMSGETVYGLSGTAADGQSGVWSPEESTPPGDYVLRIQPRSGWRQTESKLTASFRIRWRGWGPYEVIEPPGQSGPIVCGYVYDHDPEAPLGRVFIDVDEDGLWGDGDRLLADWQIRARNEDTAVSYTWRTGSDGSGLGLWGVGNMPAGPYLVSVNVPEGWRLLYPDTFSGDYHIYWRPGEPYALLSPPPAGWPGLDFGLALDLPVMGSVFHDADRSGTRQKQEVGLIGWRLLITSCQTSQVYTAETDDLGQWWLPIALDPGLYDVGLGVSQGWQQTYPEAGSAGYRIEWDGCGDYDLIGPTGASSLDFGCALVFGPHTPGGYVFADDNGNGRRESSERLLSGWEIVLKDLDYRIVARLVTEGGGSAEAGCWSLQEPLPEGNYYVVREERDGWAPTCPLGYNGAYGIHLYEDGSYDLLAPQLAWVDGLSFGVKPPQSEPVCPACPEWIAFQSNRVGKVSQIYLMRGDGYGVTPLIVGQGEQIMPVWSFDAQHIAYSSNVDGDWDIYSVLASGQEVEQWTDNDSQDLAPSWSCAGLAYQSNRDGNWEIYTQMDGAASAIRLTSHIAQDMYPQWSPDGTEIAFQSDRDGNWELYVMDADGANLQRLTEDVAVDDYPTWLPDGQSILFSSNRVGQFDLYRLDRATGVVQRLTDSPENERVPRAMPYCESVFYQVEVEGVWQVWRADQSGRNAVCIANSPAQNALIWWPDETVGPGLIYLTLILKP